MVMSLFGSEGLAYAGDESTAALATALVAARTKSLLLAIIVGVALVWALRTFG